MVHPEDLVLILLVFHGDIIPCTEEAMLHLSLVRMMLMLTMTKIVKIFLMDLQLATQIEKNLSMKANKQNTHGILMKILL